MKNVTVRMTDEQVERMTTLRTTTMGGERKEVALTEDEILRQIIERGLYAIEASRKQYTKNKDLKQLYKAIQQNPELAELAGIAHKSTTGGFRQV